MMRVSIGASAAIMTENATVTVFNAMTRVRIDPTSSRDASLSLFGSLSAGLIQ